MRRARDFTIVCLLIYAVIILTFTVIAPAIGRVETFVPIPQTQSTRQLPPPPLRGVSSEQQAPQLTPSSAPLSFLRDLSTPVQWLLPLPLAILLTYWVFRRSHYLRGRRVLAFV